MFAFVYNHLQLRVVMILSAALQGAGPRPRGLPCFYRSPERTNRSGAFCMFTWGSPSFSDTLGKGGVSEGGIQLDAISNLTDATTFTDLSVNVWAQKISFDWSKTNHFIYKCTNSKETYFCDMLPLLKHTDWGSVGLPDCISQRQQVQSVTGGLLL